MIWTFADKRTQKLYATGTAKRFPPDVAKRAARKGQCAIAINDPWRVCFRFVDGDAYDVEVCDCHEW